MTASTSYGRNGIIQPSLHYTNKAKKESQRTQNSEANESDAKVTDKDKMKSVPLPTISGAIKYSETVDRHERITR